MSRVRSLQLKQPQVCESLADYLHLGYLGQYEKQTHHFKQLVSRSNRLMPLYIALLNLDSQYV